jgi:hypothetical protein
MHTSTLTSTLLTILASVVAQDLSSSNTFALYPYITSGNLTGPYPNSAILGTPLTTNSGRASGAYTTDCFNRFVFTDYVPTHCYSGQDQCGAGRWSLNDTNPDPDCKTLVTYGAGFSSMLIADPDDVDELGRRDVGWTSSSCEDHTGTPGFSIATTNEEGILYLRYDNQADEVDVFGTFFACWVDGEIYGPKVFYRNAGGSTPEGCAEVLLVPRW